MEIIDDKDPKIWRQALKRASFKKHRNTYIVFIIFFWCIWWFTGDRNGYQGVPWPAWAMIGWGIGLALDYFNTYHGNKTDQAEREYEKMMRDKRPD